MSLGMKRLSWISVLLLVSLIAATPDLARSQSDFAGWLERFKGEAAAAGISQATLASAFKDVQPVEKVIELDRRQPEFTRTFWGYMDRAVTPKRIARGKALLRKHRKLLRKIRKRYGVQPRFLVAFWALESNFGQFTGDFPVVASLATLAYDPRRSDFFRGELLDALRIIDGDGAKPADMTGSWAGAMGQIQFMPSTFIGYAVDSDGDGRRDIWSSYPDIFASAANYLKRIGWRGSETWGREVRLPRNFDLALADLEIVKPIKEWQKLGVRRANGRNLPRARMSGSIMLPSGQGGPAFLVYQNFRSIMVWNRSLLYALAVGHLADRLVSRGALVAKRPANDQPLRRVEVEEVQVLLTAQGFDPGVADGILGSRTRAAIRAYQKQTNLPADGFPNAGLLDGLRQNSGNER